MVCTHFDSLYLMCRLVKWESYQKYSNGEERWIEACQIGRNQIRSIWERSCLTFCYTLSGCLIYVALILAMLPPKRLSRMQSNTHAPEFLWKTSAIFLFRELNWENILTESMSMMINAVMLDRFYILISFYLSFFGNNY